MNRQHDIVFSSSVAGCARQRIMVLFPCLNRFFNMCLFPFQKITDSSSSFPLAKGFFALLTCRPATGTCIMNANTSLFPQSQPTPECCIFPCSPCVAWLVWPPGRFSTCASSSKPKNLLSNGSYVTMWPMWLVHQCYLPQPFVPASPATTTIAVAPHILCFVHFIGINIQCLLK